MPPKRANSASTVAAPARKLSRWQTQPQEVSAEVLPQALVEQIVSRVSDEVTRRLSSTGGDHNANDHHIPDQISDVPAVGIPADSPGQSVIHGTVSQFQERLSGDLPTITPPLPSTLFTSPSLPIDARVSAKLRAKILKNEFIDLGALATNPTLESKYQVVLHNEGGTQPPSLALEPVTKTRKLLTISSWTSNFMVFVGVYTRQFPSEAPALMKYGEINFRYLRQNQPSAFPWGVIHWELWMRSQQPVSKKQSLPGNSFRSRLSESSIHSCPRCEGAHRMSICTFRSQSKQSPRTTTNAKSAGAKSSLPNSSKV
ncbi:unnamed protein product [Porites lobata]|uniref:Uncharacterized protein n=1 Tax=Porites lobata TaxID=104759 RepID=A0ABN8NRU0_9CNID|nr:unnamed protein product [Porites lobata]